MHFTECFVTESTGVNVMVYNMVTLEPKKIDVLDLRAGMLVKELNGQFAVVAGRTVEDDIDYLVHLIGNRYYSPLLLEQKGEKLCYTLRKLTSDLL